MTDALGVDGHRPAVARVAALPREYRLTDAEWRVLMVMACDSFDGVSTAPGTENLAAWTGLLRSTVVAALGRLLQSTANRPALLERAWTSRGRRRTEYRLLLPEPVDQTDRSTSPAGSSSNRPISPAGSPDANRSVEPASSDGVNRSANRSVNRSANRSANRPVTPATPFPLPSPSPLTSSFTQSDNGAGEREDEDKAAVTDAEAHHLVAGGLSPSVEHSTPSSHTTGTDEHAATDGQAVAASRELSPSAVAVLGTLRTVTANPYRDGTATTGHLLPAVTRRSGTIPTTRDHRVLDAALTELEAAHAVTVDRSSGTVRLAARSATQTTLQPTQGHSTSRLPGAPENEENDDR